MLNFVGDLSTYFSYKMYVKIVPKKLKKMSRIALGVIFIIISIICDLSFLIHMKTLHLQCPTILKL
jgi:hypothetical protein